MSTGKGLVLVMMSLLLAVPGSAGAFTADDVFGEVSYTTWTDYMWRGTNMTHIVGGARGKGAHDIFAAVGIATEYGAIGISGNQVYFNSYAGTDSSLAFTDIDVFLSREFEEVPGTWTFGYSNYIWNNLRAAQGPGGSPRSQELYASVDLGMVEMVNPKLTYIWDCDNADNGQLLIVDVGYPMDMAQTAPELTGLTVTPAVRMVVDHRYYGSYINNTFGVTDRKSTTKVGYFDWSVEGAYDLTELTGLTAGRLNLVGTVGYIDPVRLRELPHAKWYGNLGVAYAF